MAIAIDAKALLQRWVHSHEEDTADRMVFRPSTFQFPPSRGRRSFALNQDGSLSQQSLGPDDRPVGRQGTWRLKNGDELELNSPGGGTTVMRLVEVTPDRMVVRRST